MDSKRKSCREWRIIIISLIRHFKCCRLQWQQAFKSSASAFTGIRGYHWFSIWSLRSLIRTVTQDFLQSYMNYLNHLKFILKIKKILKQYKTGFLAFHCTLDGREESWCYLPLSTQLGPNPLHFLVLSFSFFFLFCGVEGEQTVLANHSFESK